MMSRTYVVEDVRPSLHGDALEDGEHREQDVVKVGNSKIGAFPVFPAGSFFTLPSRGVHSTGEVSYPLACGEEEGWEEFSQSLTRNKI